MRPLAPVATLLIAVLLTAGCGGTTVPASSPAPPPAPSAPSASSRSSPHAPARTPTPTSAAPSAAPSATPSAPPSATPTEHADPRWRFYSGDPHRYTSPWFTGDHRIMIGFGCTRAPYYAHDPACPGTEGIHHGIDVAMPCGTLLRSAVSGTVLAPSAPGTPGAAYGVNPFRIRTRVHGADRDILIGHTRTVFVHPGERVRPGQRLALSSDSGAPDGCHLHFEVRPHGTGYESAVDPAGLLRLRRTP